MRMRVRLERLYGIRIVDGRGQLGRRVRVIVDWTNVMVVVLMRLMVKR